MVPQPVKAVILLFPCTDDFKKKRDARYAQKLEKVGKGHIDPTIIWIKQTVRLKFISAFSTPGRTRILLHTMLMPGSIFWVDWERMRDYGDVTRFG